MVVPSIHAAQETTRRDSERRVRCESTDGAVFYPTGGKPLGTGKLSVEVGGTVFEFDSQP